MLSKKKEQWVSHNRDHEEKQEFLSQKHQSLIWSEAVANGLWEKCLLLVSLPQPLTPLHVIPWNRSSGIELREENRIYLPNLSFLSAIFGDGIHLLHFYLSHVRYKNEQKSQQMHVFSTSGIRQCLLQQNKQPYFSLCILTVSTNNSINSLNKNLLPFYFIW